MKVHVVLICFKESTTTVISQVIAHLPVTHKIWISQIIPPNVLRYHSPFQYHYPFSINGTVDHIMPLRICAHNEFIFTCLCLHECTHLQVAHCKHMLLENVYKDCLLMAHVITCPSVTSFPCFYTETFPWQLGTWGCNDSGYCTQCTKVGIGYATV